MASLGNPTEDDKRNFARGYLIDLFFILNQFHQLNRATKILQGVTLRNFFSPPGSLKNQSQILMVLQKNKALREGGHQLNSNNDTYQDRILICSRAGYWTQ